MGRGSQSSQNSPLQAALRYSPAYDRQAVEALHPLYGMKADPLVVDDGPNPNQLKKALVSTDLGIWEALYNQETDHWEIDGVEVGDKIQAVCQRIRENAANGRGEKAQRSTSLSPLQAALKDSPPYDRDAVEALHPLYDMSIGELIADDDPNPNEMKKALVSTKLGVWEAIYNPVTENWEIEGVGVGPNVQRACNFAKKFAAAEGGREQYQGPNVRTGYQLPGYSV